MRDADLPFVNCQCYEDCATFVRNDPVGAYYLAYSHR